MQLFRTLFKRFFTFATRFRLVQLAMRIAIRILVPGRRIGAALAVFNERGEVLLLHHVFHGNHPWALPGGWVNRSEMPDETVIRELKEETGLTATLGDAYFFTPSRPGKSVNVYFVATNPEGDLKFSGEINDAAWFAPDALPSGMLKRNYEAVQLAVAHLAGKK